MCGFVGVLEFQDATGKTVSPAHLQAMNESIAYRGPDDEGYLLANTRDRKSVKRFKNDFPSSASWNLGFGHKRLSILDLSPEAAQPLGTEDGDLWIVYNGEIFNYLELRAELTALGESFRTQCDTEVILKAYRVWGKECLNRFNGMWAFVIWDRRNEILFCARDRFGIKPFYFFRDSQCFVFGSEIKSILAYPQVPKKQNEEAIYDYLQFGLQDHTEKTFFKNIDQIPPAHFLIVDMHGKMTQSRWWDIPYQQADYSESSSSAIERFRDLLEDSVRIRLRSDVPIGFSVSGGLDSTAITCLAERLAHSGQRKAFSACFEEADCNDRPFIEEVTRSLNLESHFTFPNGDALWKDLDQMTWCMDEPFRSSNQFSQWSVMKLVHEHNIRVLFTGQGSDEYLAGYRGYANVYLASLIRQGKWKEVFAHFFNTPSSEMGISKPQLAARALFGLLPARISSLVRSFENSVGVSLKDDTGRFMNKGFERRLGSRHQLFWEERHADWADLPRKLYHDIFRYSLPALLHYDDRNGMAFSIEARHPFLDHRLVEFCFSLPASMKMHRGESKWILRNSMAGIIPEKIQGRKDKKGFITPESRWMMAGQSTIKKLFGQGEVACAEYLNPAKIVQKFETELSKGNYNGQTALWRPLNLEIWMRRFFSSSDPSTAEPLPQARSLPQLQTTPQYRPV